MTSRLMRVILVAATLLGGAPLTAATFATCDDMCLPGFTTCCNSGSTWCCTYTLDNCCAIEGGFCASPPPAC